jgi:eukaryotic translation initiation factor 2C
LIVDGHAEYPHLPLQHANTLPVVAIGTARQGSLVPAELCDIVAGTAYMGKLDDAEAAQMTRHARRDPATNAAAIVGAGLPRLGLLPAQGPLAAFGITVSGEMSTLTARVLPPPTVSYEADQRPNVRVCCPPYYLS